MTALRPKSTSSVNEESVERDITSSTQTLTSEDGGEVIHPTWSYATKKTVAKGMLNVSLLVTNATQLKTLFEMKTRDDLWTINVTLNILSIVLQIIAAVLMFFMSLKTPPHNNSKLQTANKLNNFTVGLVAFISMLNIVMAGLGIQVTDDK